MWQGGKAGHCIRRRVRAGVKSVSSTGTSGAHWRPIWPQLVPFTHPIPPPLLLGSQRHDAALHPQQELRYRLQAGRAGQAGAPGRAPCRQGCVHAGAEVCGAAGGPCQLGASQHRLALRLSAAANLWGPESWRTWVLLLSTQLHNDGGKDCQLAEERGRQGGLLKGGCCCCCGGDAKGGGVCADAVRREAARLGVAGCVWWAVG